DSDGDGVEDGAEDGNQNGAVDVGELDPTDPGDVSTVTLAACGTENLKQVTLITRQDQTADLVLAIPADFPINRFTTVKDNSGKVIGAMVFDPASQVAGLAVKLALAGANATAQLQGLEGTLDGAVGNVGSFTSQSFASWDSPGGNNAALGHLTWTDATAANKTAQSMNAIAQALVPGVTGLLDVTGATDSGQDNMEVEVLDRSATSIVVVITIASTARAVGDESVGFKLDDIANGTAVAQFGDTTGVQCDRFTVLPVPKVDFLLVVDNSGSMDNEQTAVVGAGDQIGAQLSNSTVDFRIGVISSDVDVNPSDEASWNQRLGPTLATNLGNTCASGGITFQQGPRYCPFTNDASAVSTCMNNLDICGSGEEIFFRAVSCSLGRNVDGPGIDQNIDAANKELGGAADGESCGRATDGSRAPFAAAVTYPSPPADFVLLPRAANDPRKIRTGAQLAVIFITDANEQSDGRYDRADAPSYPGDVIAVHSLPTWESFFQNFDGVGDPILSRAFVGGLVCPFGSGCTDETGNYENPRFTQFFSALGGIEAALPDNADPQNAAKIQAAIAAILQASIAQSSPYVLQKPPISSTIKISMTPGTTQGACNTGDVPRSRVNGFDYDGTTNSVTFFGDCRPKLDNSAVGQPFAISYQFWIEDSPNPDGDNNTCQCAPPFVCSATGACECPTDCGVAGGLAPGQTCNAQCQPECLPDCGGCANGSVCNPASADCSCQCPADCNTGAALPPNQICDPATCQPTCAPGGCQGAPPGPNFVCGPSCTYICPSDCGGAAIGPTQTCDQTTCTVTCSADCNATCSGFSTCNTTDCACECATSATCAPGFVFDATACDCVCDATALGCPATHTPNLDDCRCDCADNCGGACTGATFCAESTCTCNPVGG
ncbi:MAG TPA: hypothetical protein VGO62_20580, partial [Myxococcota bacterium]